MSEINYKDVSKSKKNVEVIFSKEEINGKFKEVYDELKGDVQVKGFRKGKVPMNIIKKRFADKVSEDIRERLFQEEYTKIIQDKGWHILKMVNVDLGDVKEDEDFIIKMEVEIRPKSDNVKYKDLPIDTDKKPDEISEEEINKVLKNIQRDKAFISPLKEDRPIKKGDMVKVSLNVEKHDEPGEYVTLYEDLDLIIDDDTPYDKGIKDSTVGKKKDEVYEYVQKVDKSKTPEEERDEIKYKITIKDIKEMELPKIDDELAKQIEFENVDKLKEYINNLLSQEKETKFREEQKVEILKLLLEANPVDELPEEFLKEAVDEEAKKANLDKLSEDKKEKKLEEIKNDVVKSLKEMMVVLDIANKEKIEVTEQEVELFFNHFAQTQGVEPQKMKELYEQNGLINKIKSDMLINKVVDFVKGLHEKKDEKNAVAKDDKKIITEEKEDSESGDKKLSDTDGSGADQ